jgi:hypothetical protein
MKPIIHNLWEDVIKGKTIEPSTPKAEERVKPATQIPAEPTKPADKEPVRYRVYTIGEL